MVTMIDVISTAVVLLVVALVSLVFAYQLGRGVGEAEAQKNSRGSYEYNLGYRDGRSFGWDEGYDVGYATATKKERET